MSKRCIVWAAIIYAPIWALVIFLVCGRCELPDGMYLATVVIRLDTVAFRPVPRQVLDSADSAALLEDRLRAFDNRRGKK